MESCPRCGVQNQSGRAACWNCFGPIQGAGAVSEGDVELVRAPRFALRIPWKPILGVAVLAGLAYGGLRVVKGRSPSAVASSYLDAVVVNDADRQAKLAASGSTGVPLLPKQFKLKEFEIQQSMGAGPGTAEVMASLTIEPDTSSITAEGAADLVAAMKALKRHVPASIELSKEGRAWKVDQDSTAKRLKTQLEKMLTSELVEKLTKRPVPGATPGASGDGSSGSATPGPAPSGLGGPGLMGRPGAPAPSGH
jgi:hypothetical protein